MNPTPYTYAELFQYVKTMKANLPQDPIIPDSDIEFIDNFQCLLCQTPLHYKPIELVDDTEIGECKCGKTFCARSIINSKFPVPVRDLAMILPGWIVALPCHGQKAGWMISSSPINENYNPLLKILLISNATFPWNAQLDSIPDFFRNASEISEILLRLEQWVPFV